MTDQFNSSQDSLPDEYKLPIQKEAAKRKKIVGKKVKDDSWKRWTSDEEDNKPSAATKRTVLASIPSSSANPAYRKSLSSDEESTSKKAKSNLGAEDKIRQPVVEELPVKKKSERSKLQGFSCADCANYYSTFEMTDSQVRDKIQLCSRHRATHERPPTPENFWEADFPSTPECERRGYFSSKAKHKSENDD